jgi:hypothetical protein
LGDLGGIWGGFGEGLRVKVEKGLRSGTTSSLVLFFEQWLSDILGWPAGVRRSGLLDFQSANEWSASF